MLSIPPDGLAPATEEEEVGPDDVIEGSVALPPPPPNKFFTDIYRLVVLTARTDA